MIQLWNEIIHARETRERSAFCDQSRRETPRVLKDSLRVQTIPLLLSSVAAVAAIVLSVRDARA